MTLSIYDVFAPTLIRMLGNISAILDKGAAHCEARKIDPTVITGYRLAPDMLPLSRQVHIMADIAKGTARLGNIELPSYPDTETTFDELKARIAKTVAFLKTFKPEQFAGAETREITLKMGGKDVKFSGLGYLNDFVFPNFYFHATTTYDILRHAGVEIGKRDFLGG